MKVFTGSAEFKSLKREIDVVRSLPAHENIVMLFGDEEEVGNNTLVGLTLRNVPFCMHICSI